MASPVSLREVTVCRAGPMCSAAGCVIIRRGTRAPPYGVQGCSLVGRDPCVPPRIRIDSVGAMWASPPTRSQGLRADGRTGSSAPTKRDVVSQGQLFRRVSSPTRDVKKRTARGRFFFVQLCQETTVMRPVASPYLSAVTVPPSTSVMYCITTSSMAMPRS